MQTQCVKPLIYFDHIFHTRGIQYNCVLVAYNKLISCLLTTWGLFQNKDVALPLTKALCRDHMS